MKRKIYRELLRWKNVSNGKTALLIDGARRVGKSYIAEEFAKNEYASYVLIDFAKVNRKVKALFDDYLDDLDTFFLFLQQQLRVKLQRGNALVIFDEVQRFPRAREAIKYLVADGRYHYLETGSLISINKNVEKILIPSEERRIKMHPMDFEEFLWAMGNETAMPLMADRFEKRLPFGRESHRQLMTLFRQYLVVGGMPQVVQEFVNSRDLDVVDALKRSILELYRNDILKFGGGVKHKALAVFNAIPSQLSRHEKRLVLADIRKGARMRDFEAAIEWLKSAMTVNVCYNATEPNVGLDLNADRSSVKCYLGDTGLLVSQAFSESQLVAADVHTRLLTGKIELNKGMLVENVVAQMIRAAGHELYFYSNSERDDAADRMEIDFLVDKPVLSRRHNISPIEVKSGHEYGIASLTKYRNKFRPYLHTAYVLHDKDVSVKDDVVRLPLYMTQFVVALGIGDDTSIWTK